MGTLTLTVKGLRQLLFEIKNQEANVVMFTEGNKECLPLVMIQDDSDDHGIVSLGFLKESKEAREAMEKIHPNVCCSDCGFTMITEGEYSDNKSHCCGALVCREEDF